MSLKVLVRSFLRVGPNAGVTTVTTDATANALSESSTAIAVVTNA